MTLTGATNATSISTSSTILSNGNAGSTCTYIPFHCAGKVSGTGSIITNSGRVGFTVSKSVTGTYAITYNSAHPSGVVCQLIQATVNGSATVGYSINIDPSPSVSGFTVFVRSLAGTLTALAFFLLCVLKPS